jgi:hypothetical protein
MAARPDAIPSAEAGSLRWQLRRTTIARVLLGAALFAALAYAFALTRGADVRRAPIVPSQTTPVVALDMSASIGDFDRIGDTLRRIGREEDEAGLVVFSDGAYELLPPGAPARELAAFARFFTPIREDVFPPNPWDAAEFRGGTSIHSGLLAARAALEREDVSRGSVVLVSDLDVEGSAEQVSDTVLAMRRDGFELRVVPVGALPRHRAFFETLLGREAFLAEEDPGAPVATAPERRLGGALPWSFLAVGALVVALLAVNERLLARLEVRP